MVLRTALEHYAQQQKIARWALLNARRRRFGAVNDLVTLVALAQTQAARDGAAAVGRMLSEQNIDADPEGTVRPAALARTASDGRDLAGLLSYAQNRTLVTPAQFDRIVLTQVRDAGRSGASVGIASRPQVTGYVRMIQGATCDRCAILAGSFYRYNTGFARHPFCDCIHVPANRGTAGDLRTDPKAYFDSLTTAEQDKAFTKSGAQAIRDGADMSQVVNARRGTQTAQVYGRDLKITTEGMTKRGLARSRMSGRQRVRLMPESIYKIAENRADAIRLLKLYGYLM